MENILDRWSIRRQLWSVAGFLGAIAHGVFGLSGENGILNVDPILPLGDWFLSGATLTVQGNVFEIGTSTLSSGPINTVDLSEWTNIYGARSPEVSLEGTGNDVTLTISAEANATIDVYKNGLLAASQVTSP